TTRGVEAFNVGVCSAVSASVQTTCTGRTAGDPLVGSFVTARFALTAGGTPGMLLGPVAPRGPAAPPLLPPPPPLPPPPSPPPPRGSCGRPRPCPRRWRRRPHSWHCRGRCRRRPKSR